MTTGLVMRNKFILAGFMCTENLSVDYPQLFHKEQLHV